MAFVAGDIVEGVVGKIVPYGAFVNLPDGKRGLIHISEIANAYVTDVNQYLKERQTVKVKVLQISPDWRKVDLSIKQVDTPGINLGKRAGGDGASSAPRPSRPHTGGGNRHTVTATGGSASPEDIDALYRQIKASTEKGSAPTQQSPFEEKLTQFLKHSEEKLSDVRKNLEAKRGGGGKRGKY